MLKKNSKLKSSSKEFSKGGIYEEISKNSKKIQNFAKIHKAKAINDNRKYQEYNHSKDPKNFKNLIVESKVILKHFPMINLNKHQGPQSSSDKQFRTFDLMNNRTNVSSLCSKIIAKMNNDKQFILSKEYLNDDSYLPSYDLMKNRIQSIIQFQGLNSNYQIDDNNLNEIKIIEKISQPHESITPLIIKKI